MPDFTLNERIYDRQKTLDLYVPGYITIIGVGGVGSWLAFDFAMAGVPEIMLYDADIVELSNLNRTPFELKHVGIPKVFAMTELIAERRECTVNAVPRNFVLKDLKNSPLPIFDMRDSIDGNGIDWQDSKVKPPINGGYDGDTVSIFTDTDNLAWKSDNPQVGYTVTPSYIVPPQIIASLIVHYIVSRKENNVRFTFTIGEMLDILAWAGNMKLKGKELKWKTK